MADYTDSDGPEYADRIAGHADVHKNAWKQTLEDMTAIGEELESEGWETVTIAAGHTAPEHPDVGNTDRFGLSYVVPGNKAEAFTDAFEAGTFPQYKVYRQEVSGRVFMVTQLMDPDTKTAILIAGSFEIRHAPALVKTAIREEEMYTHVQKLDKTHLGSFRHDDYQRFFPNAEKYDDYVVEASVGGEESDDE